MGKQSMKLWEFTVTLEITRKNMCSAITTTGATYVLIISHICLHFLTFISGIVHISKQIKTFELKQVIYEHVCTYVHMYVNIFSVLIEKIHVIGP